MMRPGIDPLATVGIAVALRSEVFGPSALARPKSSTLTVPAGVSLMLAGFKSRWTMPRS